MRKLQFKFPNQIRISGWDFGSSARAMNQAGGKDSLMTYEVDENELYAQADLEKVSRSTTERKSMSTKTTIKRIALVAVAALGLGTFAAVSPANAAHTSATLLAGSTVASGSGTAAATQVVGGIATVVLTETATAGAAGDVLGTITSSGVGTISNAVAGSGVTLTAPSYPTTSVAVSHSNTSAVNNIANTFTVTSAVAGVQTITFTPIGATGAPGTALTMTVTWGAAPVVSAQYSLVKLLAGAVTTDVTSSTTDTTATTVSRATGSQRFTIQVETYDQNNLSIVGQTLLASIEGPGLIGIADARNATTATGRSLSQKLTDNYGSISVWGDGSAGVATITISAGGVALGTKKVTFVGNPTKAVVTQNLYIAKAGTQLGENPSTNYLTNDGTAFAKTVAFTAEVTDANGNDVAAGATVKMVSSDTTVITVGSCAEWSAYPGNFECSVSGAASAKVGSSATVTFQVQDPATLLYTIAAAPITFKIGSSTIAKETMSLDSASYEPGAAMVLTASAVDASGNAIADGTASFVPTANKSVIGLPTTAGYYVNGARVSKTGIYAPSTDGAFTIVGTSGNLAGDTVSVTATVSGSSSEAQAAAEDATEAANAATDAANAAAEAADAATAAAQDAQAAVADLAAQVATLIAGIKAQITRLTNLVVKIQKKVRA